MVFLDPSGMTILGPEDFLATEEDTGKVKRVIDGRVSQTVLDVVVSTNDSRGLICIDSKINDNKTFVFLYFTKSSSEGLLVIIYEPIMSCNQARPNEA